MTSEDILDLILLLAFAACLMAAPVAPLTLIGVSFFGPATIARHYYNDHPEVDNDSTRISDNVLFGVAAVVLIVSLIIVSVGTFGVVPAIGFGTGLAMGAMGCYTHLKHQRENDEDPLSISEAKNLMASVALAVLCGACIAVTIVVPPAGIAAGLFGLASMFIMGHYAFKNFKNFKNESSSYARNNLYKYAFAGGLVMSCLAVSLAGFGVPLIVASVMAGVYGVMGLLFLSAKLIHDIKEKESHSTHACLSIKSARAQSAQSQGNELGNNLTTGLGSPRAPRQEGLGRAHQGDDARREESSENRRI